MIPGPGAYSLKASIDLGKVAIPSVKIGREKREENRFNTQPGPQSYNQTFHILRTTNPSFRFGAEKRDKTLHKVNKSMLASLEPGPGAYQHKELTGKEGPKYHIPSATRSQSSLERDSQPGPGHYNNSRELNSSLSTSLLPGIKIGTSKRSSTKDLHDGQPGPSSYNPSTRYTLHNSIQWA